jgi:hypothetical protein
MKFPWHSVLIRRNPSSIIERMFDWIDIVNNSLRRLVTTLEPGVLSGDQAAALVRELAEVERLAAAGKALAAARVDESNRWRRDGHRSAAHWMAAQTGTSVRSASEAIDTAKRVTKLPQVDQAFRSGKLSTSQAGEISAAAAASPRSEHELLDAAKTETLSGLRERCRRTRHAALPNEDARNEAIRLSRHFRHRTGPDGAFETSTRGLPVDGARLLSALAPFQKQVFDAARRAGTREPFEAYAYDALILMAESRAAAPGPTQGPTPDAPVARTSTPDARAGAPTGLGMSQRPGTPPDPSVATSDGDRSATSTADVVARDASSCPPRDGSHADVTATDALGAAADAFSPRCTVDGGEAERVGPAGGFGAAGMDDTGPAVIAGDSLSSDQPVRGDHPDGSGPPGRSCSPGPSLADGPRAMIHVRVDHAAIRRGHAVDGEICEIPGIGPVPVATARMLAADSIINVLLVDGVDVTRIAHTGRTVTAHQRSALRERSSTCEVPGCDARTNLEIDHDDPWALSKNTSLDNLNVLCRWHHYQKTHCGYRLSGTPGHRRWQPPRTTATPGGSGSVAEPCR